jgi:hypothetical protein
MSTGPPTILSLAKDQRSNTLYTGHLPGASPQIENCSPWQPLYTPIEIDKYAKDLQFVLTDNHARRFMLDFLDTLPDQNSLTELIGKDQVTQQEREFFCDFVLWLCGKPKQYDQDKTVWLKDKNLPREWKMEYVIPGDDVHAFLNMLLDARERFREQLAILECNFHGGLMDSYLYFKYIVRGDKDKVVDNWFGDLDYMLHKLDYVKAPAYVSASGRGGGASGRGGGASGRGGGASGRGGGASGRDGGASGGGTGSGVGGGTGSGVGGGTGSGVGGGTGSGVGGGTGSGVGGGTGSGVGGGTGSSVGGGTGSSVGGGTGSSVGGGTGSGVGGGSLPKEEELLPPTEEDESPYEYTEEGSTNLSFSESSETRVTFAVQGLESCKNYTDKNEVLSFYLQNDENEIQSIINILQMISDKSGLTLKTYTSTPDISTPKVYEIQPKKTGMFSSWLSTTKYLEGDELYSFVRSNLQHVYPFKTIEEIKAEEKLESEKIERQKRKEAADELAKKMNEEAKLKEQERQRKQREADTARIAEEQKQKEELARQEQYKKEELARQEQKQKEELARQEQKQKDESVGEEQKKKEEITPEQRALLQKIIREEQEEKEKRELKMKERMETEARFQAEREEANKKKIEEERNRVLEEQKRKLEEQKKTLEENRKSLESSSTFQSPLKKMNMSRQEVTSMPQFKKPPTEQSQSGKIPANEYHDYWENLVSSLNKTAEGQKLWTTYKRDSRSSLTQQSRYLDNSITSIINMHNMVNDKKLSLAEINTVKSNILDIITTKLPELTPSNIKAFSDDGRSKIITLIALQLDDDLDLVTRVRRAISIYANRDKQEYKLSSKINANAMFP